jgi:hypothetical protein
MPTNVVRGVSSAADELLIFSLLSVLVVGAVRLPRL